MVQCHCDNGEQVGDVTCDQGPWGLIMCSQWPHATTIRIITCDQPYSLTFDRFALPQLAQVSFTVGLILVFVPIRQTS